MRLFATLSITLYALLGPFAIAPIAAAAPLPQLAASATPGEVLMSPLFPAAPSCEAPASGAIARENASTSSCPTDRCFAEATDHAELPQGHLVLQVKHIFPAPSPCVALHSSTHELPTVSITAMPWGKSLHFLSTIVQRT